MLKLNDFSPHRRIAGASALAILCAATGYAAWAAQPAEVRIVTVAARPVAAPAVLPSAVAEARPVKLATAEPVPVQKAKPETITSPLALDRDRPRTVEGVIARFGWRNPSSEITIRDADGAMIVINTETSDSLVASGGSRETIRPGMRIRATGYASADGTRVYADPTQITANGVSIFPKAKADRDLPQTLSLRMMSCGAMPNALFEEAAPKGNDAVIAAVNAWQAACDTKVAQTRAQLALPSGGKPVKR